MADVVRSHREGDIQVQLHGHRVPVEQGTAVLVLGEVARVLLARDVPSDARRGVLEGGYACVAVQRTFAVRDNGVI